MAPDSLNIASKLSEIDREATVAEGAQSRSPKTVMVKMRRKEGADIWTEVKVALIRDRKGNPVGEVGVTRDVSNRKQAEEALKKAYYSLHQVLDFLSDPTFVVG